MASFTWKHIPFLLLLILLVGCIPMASPTVIAPKLPTLTTTVTSTPYPTLSPAELFRYALESLGIDVICPHFCWNGINPGVTSAAEARAILGTDLEKDSDDGFNTGSVTIENDLVKSIYIRSKGSSAIGFVFMSNFIELLGDPAEIRIEWFPGMHCDPSGSYFVYYPSRKLTLFVKYSPPDGPDLRDDISAMVLNSEFDEGAFDNGSMDNDTISLFSPYPLDKTKHPFKRQPWLGFGHIHDYLSGRSWPAC